ncbi:Uncharacterised protein [uncultured Clostridium sp.]|jgi:hypothetical protein|nr:Uncharacterised protein [uncultured Clostridium sp.]
MEALIKKLKEQLSIEAKEAVNSLTTNRLDVIYKLVVSISYLEKMEKKEWEEAPIAEAAENIIKKYSNGRYDHNIDALYDTYIAAKQAYKVNGDQGHRDKLMETVGRLMVEVYDMLSTMVMDSDFIDERQEIQKYIRKLGD